ncbi:hypothetical protein BDV19DRAFT_390271 [Aspergillus venezuelensis]
MTDNDPNKSDLEDPVPSIDECKAVYEKGYRIWRTLYEHAVQDPSLPRTAFDFQDALRNQPYLPYIEDSDSELEVEHTYSYLSVFGTSLAGLRKSLALRVAFRSRDPDTGRLFSIKLHTLRPRHINSGSLLTLLEASSSAQKLPAIMDNPAQSVFLTIRTALLTCNETKTLIFDHVPPSIGAAIYDVLIEDLDIESLRPRYIPFTHLSISLDRINQLYSHHFLSIFMSARTQRTGSFQMKGFARPFSPSLRETHLDLDLVLLEFQLHAGRFSV